MAKGFRGSAPGEVRNKVGSIEPGEVRNPTGRNQYSPPAEPDDTGSLHRDRGEEGSFERATQNERRHPADNLVPFRPGHTIQPTPAQRAENKAVAYRAAIVNSVPPARIAYYLERAAQLAEDHRSWRGMLAVAEVALQYGVGKPRQMEGEGGAVDLGALLATIAGLAEREGVAGETGDTGEREEERGGGDSDNNLTIT